MTNTKEQIQALVDAAQVASKVMREAESLVSASMHDAWHADNQPHGAYHDLRFKRIRLDDALLAFTAGEGALCKSCGSMPPCDCCWHGPLTGDAAIQKLNTSTEHVQNDFNIEVIAPQDYVERVARALWNKAQPGFGAVRIEWEQAGKTNRFHYEGLAGAVIAAMPRREEAKAGPDWNMLPSGAYQWDAEKRVLITTKVSSNATFTVGVATPSPAPAGEDELTPEQQKAWDERVAIHGGYEDYSWIFKQGINAALASRTVPDAVPLVKELVAALYPFDDQPMLIGNEKWAKRVNEYAVNRESLRVKANKFLKEQGA